MQKTEKASLDYQGSALLKSTIEVLSGHEFMIPINGILGFSEFLQRDNLSLSDEDKKKIMKDISVGATQLKGIAQRLHLWHELLDSEPAANDEVFELSSEYIKTLVFDESKRSQMADGLLIFSSELAEYWVKGNKNKFLIAIREIVQNAYKFAQANTVVSVSIAQIGKKINFSFSNYSEAATVYQLQRHTAFTRFHKRKTKQKGIGLGLAIARLGIEQCRGHIKIYRGSESNQVKIDVSLYKADTINYKKIPNEK